MNKQEPKLNDFRSSENIAELLQAKKKIKE